MSKVSGIGVVEVIGGVVLFWSGFKNQSIKNTLTGLLQGNPPTLNQTATGTVPNDQVPTIGLTDTSSSGGTTGSGGGGSTAPPAPTSISGNVANGKMQATAYGWGSGSEWNSLYALWQRESGWSNIAKNPSSGAYGIAQALPPTKYPFAGQEAGGSSATVQIAWGLSYIKQRYGDPNAAWAHEEADGWY